jgi:TonB family protein
MEPRLPSFSIFCLLTSLTVHSFAQAPPASVELPRVLEEVRPEYPAGEPVREAVVVLTVTIEPDGTVGDASVAESAGASLDEAAVLAVRRWRFSPAVRAGRAVKSRVRVPVRFDVPELVPAAEAVPSRPLEPASPAPAPKGPERATGPLEVEVHGERPLRAEHRSSADFDVPRSVLANAPKREGAEALKVAPGLAMGQVEGPAVAHAYALRGFDAEHGQDIEFRVGGLPINQPSHVHGQGYADLGFLIDETVRALHVSEGVYDPKQGDFAVAGSIDVELGVEENERGIVLRSGFGSFGTLRQLVLFAPREAENETFGAVELGRSDGYGENRAGEGASGIFQYRFGTGELRYRAIGIVHAARADHAGIVRQDDVDAGRVCFDCVYPYPTARAQNAASSRALVGLFAEHRAPGGSNADIGFFFDQSSFRLRENFTGFTDPSRSGDGNEQTNHASAVGMSSRYRTQPYHLTRDVDGTLEVGADGRFDAIDQTQRAVDDSTVAAAEASLDAGVRVFDLGVYGDFDVRFARIVKARFGFRADAISIDMDDRRDDAPAAGRSAFGIVAGPRASVTVTPLGWLSLLAAYGEGYRSPQATVIESGDAPFTKVRSGDLGARFAWGDPLELSVSGFLTRLSDDAVFDAEEGTLERIGETQRLGAVASLVSRPTDWLVESMSITAVDATVLGPPPATSGEPVEPFVEGEKVPNVPPVVVRADLGAHKTLREGSGFGRVEGRAGVGFSYFAPRPLPFDESSAPVALLDVSAGVVWGPFDLGLSVYDLLDRDDPAEEHVFVSDWDPGPGQTPEPARHVAAGAPLSWMATLGVTL